MEKELRMIKADISNSIKVLEIPYIQFQKGEETLRFMIDTGSSMNFIREEVINKYPEDSVVLPNRSEYYGIDNVLHHTSQYSFSFDLAEYRYCENFQLMQTPEALTFPIVEGKSLVIHGILGTPFLIKYHACFDYGTMEFFFSIPEDASNIL